MKFNIVLEKDEEGRYVAECIDLPGCVSEGESIEEAIQNINEAIVGCVKSRLKMASKKIKIPSLHDRITLAIDISGINYA